MWTMRFVVLWMLASGVAQADSKADVEALIGKNLAAFVSNDWTAFDATFRKDGYYFFPASGLSHLSEHIYGSHPYDIKQKIDRIVVVADDKTHVAWFHVQFSAHYKVAMLDAPDRDDVTRMIGFAIDDGGWKLAAAAYNSAFADKYLYKEVGEIEKAPVVFKGERASAEYAARWFTKGFASDQAAGTVAANGTAVGEWATGTQVGKLVAAWDKLRLWPIKIFGRSWKQYPIALIKAEVAMPVKKGQGGAAEAGAVRMRLFAIAIPDGKAWKWTALSFGGWYDDEMYPGSTTPGGSHSWTR